MTETSMTPPDRPAGNQWRTTLLDSVMALRDASREYRAALHLAQSGTWSVDLLRVRGVDGRVHAGQRFAFSKPRPHAKALLRIHQVFTTAAGELERLYEAAALAYAYGAAWATRQVLDGASPTHVEFIGRDAEGLLEHPDPLIPIATKDGQGVAGWCDAARFAAAREALATCLAAGDHGEDLCAKDYVTDHEASDMHRAWDIARGTAEAAYAYGLRAEEALQFALNVARRSG